MEVYPCIKQSIITGRIVIFTEPGKGMETKPPCKPGYNAKDQRSYLGRGPVFFDEDKFIPLVTDE